MKQIVKEYYTREFSKEINKDLETNKDWEIFQIIPIFPHINKVIVLVVYNINPTKNKELLLG